ncbi:hypothetical protein Mal15_41060 [Stieleria maiorica]|uniref:Uncharacterized protein n=1 Tax=Stieleria maiorica TaxID=2795974 RepID=A0A5B9MME2_9BACT|nr:hypothetical protein [Stieleria maiorica]QEG00038.1 hypothetical protein Mal15_41060 [Stieleria maiorica]
MDQVKEYLAVAIKHGFWIGSSLVLIGALGVWYLSTSDLNAKTDAQIRKIEGDVQKVSQYQGELPTQPNDLSHLWMNEKIEIRKQEVLTAWQNVFDAQRDILTWPTKLKDEFVDEFKYVRDPETGKIDKNRLKLPFEKYEQFPPSSDTYQVNPAMLRRYEQYIGEVLPSYAKIAGADWTADFKKRSAGMGADYGMDDMMMMSGPGMTRRAAVDITGAVKEPVVKWSTSSQEAVLKDLFPWRGAKEYPSELDVYYSQENLWIMRQLLEIVAAVNGGAQQAFEAEIREIKKLSIGRSVTFNQGSISDPGSRITASFGGMDDMMEGYEDMGDMYSMDEGGMGGMGGDMDGEGSDPGDNRYVNTANEPIDASSLRGAFSSNDPGQVAIAVAKRVPVMMHLQMNQQSVARLLAACGSAPLMVDVRQVRVMPKGGSSSTGGGGGYDMMGMEDEMMMGGMGGGMGMGGMGMGGGMTAGANDEFPMDMDVEIYGLIYFYNPPSEESLGIDKVKDDVSIDESAEVIDALPGPSETEPATTTPPTTTPPTATPPTTEPPAATQPPATTPPAATPPATTPPATEPPAATPPATAPPAATPPTAMAVPVATP